MQKLSMMALRVLIAAIFLWHGVPKAFDPEAGAAKFVDFGLPGLLGPTVGIVEVVAGLLLAAGILQRWAAGSLLVIILGALVTVQLPAGITAGLERDVLVLAGLLVIFAHAVERDSAVGTSGEAAPS